VQKTKGCYFLELNELILNYKRLQNKKEEPWCKIAFQNKFWNYFSIENGSEK
jgi:hypothetical protein